MSYLDTYKRLVVVLKATALKQRFMLVFRIHATTFLANRSFQTGVYYEDLMRTELWCAGRGSNLCNLYGKRSFYNLCTGALIPLFRRINEFRTHMVWLMSNWYAYNICYIHSYSREVSGKVVDSKLLLQWCIYGYGFRVLAERQI